MAQKTPSQFKRFSIIGVLVLLVIVIGYVTFGSQSASINQIGGEETIITGTLFKDSPVGIEGQYFIVGENGVIAYVHTDTNLDGMVRQKVTASGQYMTSPVAGEKSFIILSGIQKEL